MSPEITTVAAAAASAALLRARAVRQRRIAASATWFALTLPRRVDSDAVISALRSLSGLTSSPLSVVVGTGAVVLEVGVHNSEVAHRVAVPSSWEPAVLGQFRAAMPGLHVGANPPRPAVTFAVELGRRGDAPLRDDESESVAAGVLMALSGMSGTAVIQWTIAPVPGVRREVAPERRDRRQDLEPLLAACVRIGATNPSDIGRLVAAVRASSTPGARLVPRRIPSRWVAAHVVRSRPPFLGWPCPITARELAGLIGLPLGSATVPALARAGARVLPPSPRLAVRGRVLGVATGTPRPVALTPDDALRHLYVVGPTGVGKSTLLLQCIVRDLEHGHGVVILDPKGDLAADVLTHVPRQRRDDVVVLDPADTDCPVGLNVLGAGEHNPDLVVDQVAGALRRLFHASYWGPRLDDILRASLATLARAPGMTLCEIPPLLTNTAFRRRLVAGIDDPVALEPFWEEFDQLSNGARNQWIAPVQNKLRAVLGRRAIRNVVGQSEGIVIADLLAERKVLVVNLAKGLVGDDAAALLGSLVLTSLWQALERRAGLPPAERHRTYVYLDEFQDYLSARLSLADALAQARGTASASSSLTSSLVSSRPRSARRCSAPSRPRLPSSVPLRTPGRWLASSVPLSSRRICSGYRRSLPMPPFRRGPRFSRPHRSRRCRRPLRPQTARRSARNRGGDTALPSPKWKRRSAPAAKRRHTSFRHLADAGEDESGRLSDRFVSHSARSPVRRDAAQGFDHDCVPSGRSRNAPRVRVARVLMMRRRPRTADAAGMKAAYEGGMTLDSAAISARAERQSYMTRARAADVLASLSARERAVVETLRALSLASGSHIWRLHFADAATPETGARLCRRTLRRLADLRVVARLDRRVGGARAGSESHVYALDIASQDLSTRRRRPRTPGSAFIAHALDIAELYVRLWEAARGGLEVLTVSPEPACWRTYPGPTGPQWCKPDLFVCVALDDFEDHWFVEIDRATQSGAILERKAAVYASYWRAGVRDPFPLVLFTVPDERRRRFVADVLGRLPGEVRPLFRVALFDDAVRLISGAGATP